MIFKWPYTRLNSCSYVFKQFLGTVFRKIIIPGLISLRGSSLNVSVRYVYVCGSVYMCLCLSM